MEETIRSSNPSIADLLKVQPQPHKSKTPTYWDPNTLTNEGPPSSNILNSLAELKGLSPEDKISLVAQLADPELGALTKALAIGAVTLPSKLQMRVALNKAKILPEYATKFLTDNNLVKQFNTLISDAAPKSIDQLAIKIRQVFKDLGLPNIPKESQLSAMRSPAPIRPTVSQDKIDSAIKDLRPTVKETPLDPSFSKGEYKKTKNINIVKKSDAHDFLGMRASGKNVLTAKPGEPGALGNPYVAIDAGGKLSREEATKQFGIALRNRASRDPEFANWLETLRGKNIGYYKPDEEFIHLQELDKYLDETALKPSKTTPSTPPSTSGPKKLKIISGGQTGADRAGLDAAKSLGLETGGYAPRGFKTEKGPDPSLKDFGLTEHVSSNYNDRTMQNILESDATIIFGDVTSTGSKNTLRFAKDTKKPVLVNPTASELKAFLSTNNISTLNIAGNRASVNPNVYNQTKSVLEEALAPLSPSKSSKELSFSTPRMTGYVKIENGKITDAAPIMKKFVGQPEANLRKWLDKQGPVDIHDLSAIKVDPIAPKPNSQTAAPSTPPSTKTPVETLNTSTRTGLKSSPPTPIEIKRYPYGARSQKPHERALSAPPAEIAGMKATPKDNNPEDFLVDIWSAKRGGTANQERITPSSDAWQGWEHTSDPTPGADEDVLSSMLGNYYDDPSKLLEDEVTKRISLLNAVKEAKLAKKNLTDAEKELIQNTKKVTLEEAEESLPINLGQQGFEDPAAWSLFRSQRNREKYHQQKLNTIEYGKTKTTKKGTTTTFGPRRTTEDIPYNPVQGRDELENAWIMRPRHITRGPQEDILDLLKTRKLSKTGIHSKKRLKDNPIPKRPPEVGPTLEELTERTSREKDRSRLRRFIDFIDILGE